MPHAQEGPNWIIIGEHEDRHAIAFQRVDDFRPPQWPDPAHPQQMHLDLVVDDLDTATAQVLALGATALPGQSAVHRVFADPVGHPFCLSVVPAADTSITG